MVCVSWEKPSCVVVSDEKPSCVVVSDGLPDVDPYIEGPATLYVDLQAAGVVSYSYIETMGKRKRIIHNFVFL